MAPPKPPRGLSSSLFSYGISRYHETKTRNSFGLLLSRANAASWVPVRSLWCGVCFAGFFILAPPTHLADKSADIGAHFGRLVGARSLAKCGVRYAGFFMLAAPTHPTARKPPRGSGRAARAPERGCSFVAFPPLPRTLFTRPPPLYGGERCPPPTAAGFLVRCRGLLAPVRFAGFCGLLLRAAFARSGCGSRSPKGQAKHGWLCSTARHIMACPLGGAFRRGAPIPCPRRPAPPNPLRAAFALPARCSCAPSALRLRGC